MVPGVVLSLSVTVFGVLEDSLDETLLDTDVATPGICVLLGVGGILVVVDTAGNGACFLVVKDGTVVE